MANCAVNVSLLFSTKYPHGNAVGEIFVYRDIRNRGAVGLVEVLCIDRFTRKSQLQDLNLAAAVKDPVGKRALHDQPKTTERKACNQGESANDARADDASDDHHLNAGFFELEGWFAPS